MFFELKSSFVSQYLWSLQKPFWQKRIRRHLNELSLSHGIVVNGAKLERTNFEKRVQSRAKTSNLSPTLINYTSIEHPKVFRMN